MASKKKPKKTARKRTPRETSDRVSTEAAKALAVTPRSGTVVVKQYLKRGYVETSVCKASVLRSILASALNQDQTRGRRDGRVKR
jgi:hypothetical protein